MGDSVGATVSVSGGVIFSVGCSLMMNDCRTNQLEFIDLLSDEVCSLAVCGQSVFAADDSGAVTVRDLRFAQPKDSSIKMAATSETNSSIPISDLLGMHDSIAMCVDVKDGKCISGGFDSTVRIWGSNNSLQFDAQTFNPPHVHSIVAGKTVFAGLGDGVIRVLG